MFGKVYWSIFVISAEGNAFKNAKSLKIILKVYLTLPYSRLSRKVCTKAVWDRNTLVLLYAF